MGAAQSTTFECGICTDEKKEVPHWADGSPVCKECVVEHLVPLFDKAYDFEHCWPPPWGSSILDVRAFKDVLGDYFVERYLLQEERYKVPLNKRRLCTRMRPFGGPG